MSFVKADNLAQYLQFYTLQLRMQLKAMIIFRRRFKSWAKERQSQKTVQMSHEFLRTENIQYAKAKKTMKTVEKLKKSEEKIDLNRHAIIVYQIHNRSPHQCVDKMSSI